MADILHERFLIKGAEGLPIRGDVRLPVSGATGEGKLRPVVVCHGFKGFKDWGFHPYLGEQLARAGYYAVHFNFSHNGVGDELLEFTELELFKENAPTLEIEDLQLVVAAIKKKFLPASSSVDESKIFLIGHSRGGISVTAVAAEDDSIAGVVTLAAVSKLPSVDQQQAKEWREKGVWFVRNGRTGQDMPLGLRLLDELEGGQKLVEENAKRIKAPALVVHGDADPTVSVDAAYRLDEWIENSKLLVIQGGDHVFGAKHPLESEPEDLRKVTQEIVEFLSSACR